MANKGFAVVSGSNTVVAKILENGTVVLGDDMPIQGKVSGTLVLDLPSGVGDNRVVQVDSNNSASLAQLSASQIINVPSGNLLSTDVQSALDELQSEIDSLSASLGGTVLAVSASNGTGDLDIQLGQLQFASNDSNLSVSLTDGGDSVLVSLDFADSPTFSTVTATTVTASGQVSANTLNVATNATVGGNLTVNGDLVVSGSTVVLEVENLKIEDPIIVLGSSSAGQVLDGDRGLIFAQSASGNDPAFGWDAVDGVFRLGVTSDDGTTPNLTINPNAKLELGELLVTGSVTVNNGLTVTGAVNLPNGSISNAELENSSINISGGVGITVSGLQSISLGGSGSITLDLSELPTVTVDVGADSLAIVDASNSSGSSLTTVADLATGMAGTGISALAGVLSVDYGSIAGTAVEGDTTLVVSGTANEVNVTVNGSPGDGTLILGSGGTLQIGLPDSVTIASDLTVGNNLLVSGNVTLGTDSADLATVVGQFKIGVFTVSGANNVAGYPIVPDSYSSSPTSFSGHMFYLTSSAVAGSGSFAQGNKWYFNENGVWHASHFFVE